MQSSTGSLEGALFVTWYVREREWNPEERDERTPKTVIPAKRRCEVCDRLVGGGQEVTRVKGVVRVGAGGE